MVTQPVAPSIMPSSQGLEGPRFTPSPEAFGAGVGKSLAAMGGQISAYAEALHNQELQAQRFDALRKFSDFQVQVQEHMVELQRNMPPNQRNFPDVALASYRNMEAKFLNDLGKTSPELQREFSARTAQVSEGVAAQALRFQLAANDAYFKQGIATELDRSQNNLANSSDTQALALERQRIAHYIAATALPDAEKVSEARSAYKSLEGIVYRNKQLDIARGDVALGPGGAAHQGAVELMQTFGNDQNPGDVSYEENLGLLDSRATHAEQEAVAQLGNNLDLWAALPDRARSALIMMQDDLGELPTSVVNAVRAGDLGEVADAVKALGGAKNDQLAKIIRGDETVLGVKLDNDPAFGNLPYEDRLALTADAVQQATKEATAQQKALDTQRKKVINDFFAGVELGKPNYGQAMFDALVENGVLTDADDIAKGMRLLDEAGSNVRAASQAQAKLDMGASFDPSSTEDKKGLNALIGKEGLAALQNGDQDYASTTLMNVVEKAQDVPTDVAGLLTGMARSQNPQRAMFALDLMSMIQDQAPQAFNQRFGADETSMVQLWRTGRDYLSQDELLGLIRGGSTQEERQRQAILKDEATKFITSRDSTSMSAPTQLEDLVTKILDDNKVGGVFGIGAQVPTLGIDPNAARELQVDAQNLFVTEYMKYGNSQKALDATEAQIERLWGTTSVGGQPVFMKYPPEKAGYKPIGGNFDWMTQQLKDETNLNPNTIFSRNRQWINPEFANSNFQTKLTPEQETQFRSWVKTNNVAFNPDATTPQDYDMRGFWLGLQNGDPHATTGVDPNDGKLHFTDYWKTPYHVSFSNESKYATANAPHWNGDQLVESNGTVLYDDKAGKVMTEPNDTFQLISDEQTRAEMVAFQKGADGAHPPSYMVIVRGEDGTPRLLTDADGRPERHYFEVTPAMKAAQDADFAAKRDRVQFEQFRKTWAQAIHHSMATGIAIPRDLWEEAQQWTAKYGDEMIMPQKFAPSYGGGEGPVTRGEAR